MSETTEPAPDDRVSRAMQAILQLQEDAEAVARAHGVSTEDEASSPPDAAPETASEAVTVEENAREDDERPADDLIAEANAALRSLAERQLSARRTAIDAWRHESIRAVDEWRARALTVVSEQIASAEASAEEAGTALRAAQARLSDLAR